MIDGIGGIGYDLSAGGLALGDNNRRPRLFKITAGSNPYTASEVVLLETDGSKSNTGIYDVTAAQKVLWEVNGNTSVPVNTIVEATPNAAGLGFYFGYTNPGGITTQTVAASGQVITTASGPLNTQLITSLTVSVTGTYLVLATAAGNYRTDTVGDYMYLTINLGSAYGYLCPIYSASVNSLMNVAFVDVLTLTSGATLQLLASRIFAGTVTTSVVNAATLTIIKTS